MATIGSNQQKITPCLWFEGNAAEAVEFYTSVFKNSRKGKTSHYGEGAPLPKGTVLTQSFELDGQEFLALNGGPEFKFTEAVSFMVNCNSQEEIDYFWEKLSDGGATIECGWLKDKFGLAWQIVPANISELINDEDPDRSTRVLQAVWKMKKLDIATLERAYEGAES